MTKQTWGGVMLISLLVTSGAGTYLYNQMGKKDIISMTPVEEPTLPPKNEPAAAPSPTTSEPTPPAAPTSPMESPANEETRNILFRFPKPSAKSVSIVGDFNEWKPQVMTKSKKGWEISVPLSPGEYQYLFVVNDKKVKDPNNKTVVDGKSLIKVKPLEPQKS